MKIRYVAVTLIVFLVVLVIFLFQFVGVRFSIKENNSLSDIQLPQDFHIEIFADGLGGSQVSIGGPNPGPRMLEFNKDKILFTSIPSQGKVVALPDRNNDGRADETITFIDGLNKPHGLAFYQEWLYIAEEDKVIRVKDLDNDLKADLDTLETVVSNIPAGEGHFTRTIKISGGYLYISIGSSCNVCNEENPWRASIVRCNVDGKDCKVFASGLRNSVGFIYNSRTGEIWATENGRDWLGDDLPPEEINIIKEGRNYGWPICYGNKIHDTDFDKNVYIRDPCEDTEPPAVEMQAHSAPLGLAFNYGDNFPSEYQGGLFVAFHGSWNRGVPTGYKIVRIDKNLQVNDFATGWLKGSQVLGRPVDIVFSEEGMMYVSDDNAGVIYRIFYS